MAQKKKHNDELQQLLLKIAERIEELREKKDPLNTQEKFAALHDISPAQWNRYSKGGEDMRISSLQNVLKALGVTFDEFFKVFNDK